MGTQINMPGMPQMLPQNANANNTVSGLKFILLPIQYGSTKFPMINCMAPTAANIQKEAAKPSNITNENTKGNNEAIIDPMFGIKLKEKIKNAPNKCKWQTKQNKDDIT